MSRNPWLHHDPLPRAGETATLDAEEARHVRGAHRLRAGDEVVLSDGRGRTATAVLVDAARGHVHARVVDVTDHAPESPAIHLASALPKGDRLATLLAMATQLGVASFTPLLCRHGVVVPPREPEPRWQRIVRESAKQSRRPFLPALHPPVEPDALVRARHREAGVWLLDRDAPRALSEAAAGDAARPQWLLVGPEGGFDAREREAIRAAGAHEATLGAGVLRIETAAVAGLAVLRAALGAR